MCVEEISTEDSRPDRLGFGEKLLFTGGMCFNGAVDNTACFSSTSLVALHAGIHTYIYIYMYYYTYLGPFSSTCIKLTKTKHTHTHHIDMEVEQKK